ncbi:MAG: RsmB/NOP family class I SAM-dependent RNA methyltransferase [Pseudomonadota bacterium]
MTPAARIAAAIDILDRWQVGEEGLDRVLAAWGRAHRFAGSADRRAIADHCYAALRRARSAAWVAGVPESRQGRALMLGSLRLDGLDPVAFFTGQGHAPPALSDTEHHAKPLEHAPEAVRLDLPDWLLPDLDTIPRAALERLRHRAPLHLRVNLLKTNRDDALAALRGEGIAAEPGPLSPTCLSVIEGARRVAGSTAYRDGLVEIQDAASQAVADLADPRPGETVLDFCAGGGGKTLALGSAMAGQGRLLAHDSNPARLAQLAPRALRAGLEVETLAPGDWQDLRGACDLVVVDAPCSGSGAWARNPDAKWRLTPARLDALRQTQAEVLARGAACVRPGGRLLYATCSLIEAENGAQVERFLAQAPFRCTEERRFTPLDGGDGFYAALLQR